MDSGKSTVRKSTGNAKLKSTSATTLTTKQSGKDSEPEVKQSPTPNKRGPKRKLPVIAETNVKKTRLRSNRQKPLLTSTPKTTSTKKAKEKKLKSDATGDDSSDDPFTEEEEEETSLKNSSEEEKPSPKNSINTKSQLNGEKNKVLYTSPRVRKPNPKFQDFITSPKVRAIANSEKQIKEKIETPKIKVKQRVKNTTVAPVEKDPLDIVNMKPEPNAKDDDVVHSFLPVLDKPKVLYDSDEGAFNKKKSKIITSSGTDVENNSQKTKNKPNVVVPTNSDLSSSVDTTTNTITPVIITPQIVPDNPTATVPVESISAPLSDDSKVKDNPTENESLQKKTNDQNENQSLQKKPNNQNENQSLQKKPNNQNENQGLQKKPNNQNVRKYTRTPVERKKKALTETKKKEETRYCLIESEGVSYRTKSTKANDVDFNKLVRTLKSVKLPASNWKIRIVVSRQQTITEVTFTNKEANERCVKFSRVFTGYVITFGKSVVKLVGAPSKISSFNDVTILLDIIHNLSLNDPILFYVPDEK